MLRGPYDGICVKKEGTLETASENVEKIFNLNLELLSVLKYLSHNDNDFDKWHEDKTNLTLKETCEIIKNTVIPCLNSLNFDLNEYMQKLGLFYYKERKDELPFKSVDIKNNTFLNFIDLYYISKEDKFLSLSSYFRYKLENIMDTNKNLSKDWKDDQYLEYMQRFNSIVEFSLGKYPRIFKEYSKTLDGNFNNREDKSL